MYTNFWQTGASFLAALLESFDRSLKSGSLWGRIKSLLAISSPKVKVKSPGGMVEFEARVPASEIADSVENLFLIDRYCEKFASDKKPAFLLFDEFQEMARTDGLKSPVASLRAAIDTRKSKLIPIFAGSSQGELRRMFSERDAPFFHFAYSYDLPPLDGKFVDYLLGKVGDSTSGAVNRSTAMSVFDKFDQNPLLFRTWLAATLAQPDVNSCDVIDSVLADINSEFNLQELWAKLSLEQQCILKTVANGNTRLGDEFICTIVDAMGRDIDSMDTSMQSEVDELVYSGILDRWNGGCQFGDPLFKAWILSLPESNV